MRALSLLSVIFVVGCGGGEKAAVIDAAMIFDTGAAIDAGPAIDAGMAIDTRRAVDTGMAIDTGMAVDEGPAIDAGMEIDMGVYDETMDPGLDCLACHQTFSVGGTVYPSDSSPLDQGLAGVTVTILDSAQVTLTLTSNQGGNFYSKAPIVWPADITFTLGTRTAKMLAATSGACNTCHTTNRQSLMYLE